METASDEEVSAEVYGVSDVAKNITSVCRKSQQYLEVVVA
jgi:hypothetical protein